MISRQAWSDANFYRPHTGIRFIRQLWRRRCGMWMSTRYLDRKSRSPSEPGTEGNLRDHWMLIRFHHTSEWWDCTALATLASVSVWWRLYCRPLASLIFTLLLLISVSCSFVLVELGDQLVLSLTIGLLDYCCTMYLLWQCLTGSPVGWSSTITSPDLWLVTIAT